MVRFSNQRPPNRDMVWREMGDLSEDRVLLVLAGERYDEADCIRDYKEFSNLRGLLYEA